MNVMPHVCLSSTQQVMKTLFKKNKIKNPSSVGTGHPPNY